MRRIFVDGDLTTELKNNHKTEALNNSSIALLNAAFVVKHYNLYSDAFFMVSSPETKHTERIEFKAGFWTRKTFIDTFNAQSKKLVSLDELQDGKLRLRVAKGYKLGMSDNLPHLMGLSKIYDSSKKLYKVHMGVVFLPMNTP